MKVKKLLVLCLSILLIAGCGSTQPDQKGKNKETISVKEKKLTETKATDKETEKNAEAKTDGNDTNTSSESKSLNQSSKDKTNTKSEESKQNPSTEQKPVDKPTTPQQPQQPSQSEKPSQSEQPSTPQYTESSYAEEVRNLINSIRVKNGLPALYSNALLTSITQQRVDHQLQSYGHRLPDGTHSGTWIENQGIIPGGEDVAMMSQGFLPQAVVNAWMESPGHRAPILADYNSYMDIAVRFANGRVYVVACWQQ